MRNNRQNAEQEGREGRKKARRQRGKEEEEEEGVAVSDLARRGLEKKVALLLLIVLTERESVSLNGKLLGKRKQADKLSEEESASIQFSIGVRYFVNIIRDICGQTNQISLSVRGRETDLMSTRRVLSFFAYVYMAV